MATLTMRQYAGHVVGGRITRVGLPSVRDEDVTTTAITVTRSGDIAVVGWTGSLALGVAYPYSAVRHGTTWRLAAGRSPSAPFGIFGAVASVGDTLWTAGMAGVVGRGTAPFERLAAGGWSPPQALSGRVGERTVAMAGLPSGEGWALTLRTTLCRPRRAAGSCTSARAWRSPRGRSCRCGRKAAAGTLWCLKQAGADPDQG